MKKVLKIINYAMLIVVFGASCNSIGNNRQYDPDCSNKMLEFGNVEILGSFADNLGCMYTTMSINGYYYEYYEGVQILAKEIFHTGDKDKMVKLIDKIYLQHSTIVKESNEDFKLESMIYSPIKVSSDKRNYTIKCWVMDHAAMIPVQEYELLEFRIDRNGNIKKKPITGFSHSM